VTFQEAPQPASVPVAAEDSHAASVFGGPEEQTFNPAQIGWHSAPNLFLSPENAEPATPAIDVAPLLTTSEPVAFELPIEFAAVPPAPTSAPAPVPVPQDAPQAPQFFVGADAVATVPAPILPPPEPTPVFAAAPTSPAAPAPFTFGPAPTAPAPVFTPAPAPAPVPTPAPQFTFGAAPTAQAPVSPAPAPLTFGAAPATVPAPAAPATSPAPLTFGAAPAASPAPAAFPTFNAAPASAAPAPTMPPTTTVAQEATAFAEAEAESRQKFLMMLLIIIGSYASAITIVLVYTLISSRTSALESLPDLKPPVNKNGDISWKYNPPMNDVPWGHVLALGQSRRFGSIKVTPTRVTRGKVQFEHYSGKAGLARDPSDTVLKLWVKFENVSRDQSVIPLDSHVLYTRRSVNLGESIQANGFITLEANRKTGKSLFYLFDTPVLSEFRMVGQDLNHELAPGESFETFIPSEEDAKGLSGDLVWRFQFRKGHNRQSQRGVTTLIDVRFNSKDITDDRG
jgi:hypothetical protein